MSNSELVWLITGTTAGLGRLLALAALERGDKVIATGRARSFSKLEDLKAKGAAVIELDVNASLDDLHGIAKKAIAIYGRVDVLVNNAGYIAVGVLEEVTPEETISQFNTNVFGGLNIARAFLPYMRERKTGTIVWMGSLWGWRGMPYAGLYCGSKWTLRGISYSLHAEIEPLGLRSIIFDFGFTRTSFLSDSQRAPAVSRISDYEAISKKAEDDLNAYNGKQPGDPEKGVRLMLDVIKGTGIAAGKAFPRAVAVGSDSYDAAKEEMAKEVVRLDEWKEASFAVGFDE
ncbi:short chain dehydrogenase [Coprinopsis sp. MPI-PUGE-AT-0042]|nr:short chain dehydrogenase [Coprinopsis sp. MPI-PUGE-AT-0042]